MRSAAAALAALLLAAATPPPATKPDTRPAPTLAPKHKPLRHRVHKAPLVTKTPPAPTPPPKPVAPAKPAPPKPPADVGTSTGLHLPRFASLKTDDVNMRSGPGERYPVLWVYKRRDLPVEITREFDVWRLVVDMDGVRGWVHQATLTGHRSFVVTAKQDQTLRAEPDASSDPVAILRPGVIGRVRKCDAGAAWCQVSAGDYAGWLPRDSFWGTAPGEAVQP